MHTLLMASRTHFQRASKEQVKNEETILLQMLSFVCLKENVSHLMITIIFYRMTQVLFGWSLGQRLT